MTSITANSVALARPGSARTRDRVFMLGAVFAYFLQIYYVYLGPLRLWGYLGFPQGQYSTPVHPSPFDDDAATFAMHAPQNDYRKHDRSTTVFA